MTAQTVVVTQADLPPLPPHEADVVENQGGGQDREVGAGSGGRSSLVVGLGVLPSTGLVMLQTEPSGHGVATHTVADAQI